jgi:hypothetical protein
MRAVDYSLPLGIVIVLALCQIASAEPWGGRAAIDDDARIQACIDLAIMERWLDRAVIAISVSDALG